MFINKQTKIGDLVTENYAFSDVFYDFSIDFCCGGNRSIQEACPEKDQQEELIRRLKQKKEEVGFSPINTSEYSLTELINYIEQNHHAFIETQTPIIRQHLEKITQVHGTKHPELNEIKGLFLHATDELIPHLKKEELMLFPLVKKLEVPGEDKTEIREKISELIEILDREHTEEGEFFQEIAKLTNGYQPPEDACKTYEITFSKLEAFEKDLHQHVHLENNILFSRLNEYEE